MQTTRRRFLVITAAAAAAALPRPARASRLGTWRGVALGAQATIRLDHPDAAALTARAAAEIDRLEDVFSLYRRDSALSRLNAVGRLDAPPFELLECLSLAGAVHRATDGRFDPTVQPLWTAFARAGARGRRLSDSQVAALRAQTGWSRLRVDSDAIALAPGMELTLNGIAQGYIADRVARLLSEAGLSDVLIDTGEFRALGGHPDGGAWPVRLNAGGALPLRDRALATSAPLGTTFDAERRQGHILDPRTGRPTAPVWTEITVTAHSAALADAASTAACLMPTSAEIERSLAKLPDVTLEAATPG